MTLDELINQSKDASFYQHKKKSLSSEQLEKFEAFANELHAQGATEPLSWAFSEAQENIAQRARYYALREFYHLTEDVEGNVVNASCDFHPDSEKTFQSICDAIGKKQIEDFLKAYGRAMMGVALDIIDDGHIHGAKVGWSLSETDADGAQTGRLVDGLHEDWLEFEKQTNAR